jgi:hypothetical protein
MMLCSIFQLRVGLINEKEQSSVQTHENFALDDGGKSEILKDLRLHMT